MGFLAPFLIGAVSGVAGTWTYLRRRSQKAADKSDIIIESKSEESASDVEVESQSTSET